MASEPEYEIAPPPMDMIRKRTHQDITAEFQEMVRELGGNIFDLAERLHKLGDYRPIDTTLRGIKRMMSGETRVSGEMKALVAMMINQQRRVNKRYEKLAWTRLQDGAFTASTDDFRIILSPKSRGRWLVDVIHKDGYSHSWPRWQDSVEAAKQKALTTLDDATDTMIGYELINKRVAADHEQAEKMLFDHFRVVE